MTIDSKNHNLLERRDVLMMLHLPPAIDEHTTIKGRVPGFTAMHTVRVNDIALFCD